MAGYILDGPPGASPAMAKKVGKDQNKTNTGANLGFEQQLWQMPTRQTRESNPNSPGASRTAVQRLGRIIMESLT
jgi:hypothetical protein